MENHRHMKLSYHINNRLMAASNEVCLENESVLHPSVNVHFMLSRINLMIRQ